MNELVTEVERMCFWKLSMLNRNSWQTDRQKTDRQTNHNFLSWSKNFPNGMGPESSLPQLGEPHYQSIPSYVSLGLQNNYFPYFFFYNNFICI